MHNPFIAPFSSLPGELPVLPLPDAVVMPGVDLPLNIFEPRYLNLVADALAADQMFGMSQPGGGEPDKAPLSTGCAGRITRYQETYDGRIELVLTGVCRFDVQRELPMRRGYRRIVPDWTRFEADYSEPGLAEGDGKALLAALREFAGRHGMRVNIEVFEMMSDTRLANTLITALPLSGEDKQLLVECAQHEQRAKLLLPLMAQANEPHPVTH